MKVGYRKPSIKKSVKARTTGKIKRKAKKAINPFYGKKGMGYIKNPKRAIKNKVYHKTTFGTNDIIRAASSGGSKSAASTSAPYVMNAREMNPIAYFCIVFFLGPLGVHRFIDGSVGMGVLYLFTVGLFGIGYIIDVIKALVLLIKSDSSTSSKEKLLQLQKAVMPNSPDSLVMTRQQLMATANQQASDDIRIAQDSSNIVSTTNKPDVFFSRLDLLKSHTYHMQLLEPFVPFTVSPTAAMNEILTNEQEIIHQFIIRYYNSVNSYANSLKTDNGKYNQYKKFYDTMSAYQNKMSPDNFNYIEQLFNQATSQLSASNNK